MPATVRIGSGGPTVRQLQARLNAVMPQAKPALVVDGMFGPRTKARVIEFQKSKGLVPDGIVGPLTWAALDQAVVPGPPPSVLSLFEQCGCAAVLGSGVPAALARFVQLNFAASSAGAAGGPGASAPAGATPMMEIAGVKVRDVTDGEKAKLAPYYGSSISYSNVYMSNQVGSEGRAFVLTVKPPYLPRIAAIQIVNIGDSYKDSTLIHEFGHVWQAQHHDDPFAYMVNALASQAAAGLANKASGTTNYSAYCYIRGDTVRGYGAEQLAQMIMNGEKDMIDHVKGFGLFSVDKDLLPSPKIPLFEDKTKPGARW